MAVPTTASAVRVLEEGHEAVRRLLAHLSDEDLTRPATIGGGDWSARDLLGHLTSWEEIALETLADWRRGDRPAVEDVFAQSATDRLNEENVGRKARLALAEVRGAFEAVHGELVGAIHGIGDEEWASEARYGTGTTLGELLGGVLSAPERPFGHAFAHLPDLEAYVASLGTKA